MQKDKTPPYIGLFPGTTLTFHESLETEKPSPQQWPHRPYCELLQADILPANLANLVIDCMRAHGATTLGVVSNVWRFGPQGREILGFISYGYAQMLLRLDRIEEFLLFLYAHRYHVHTRGSWTAGEVTGITGESGTYCVPAQQTIPLLVRWMLVMEDSDEEILYLAKGVPRDWVASGKQIQIQEAPTRWGRVTFSLITRPEDKVVVGQVELTGATSPKEVHFKLRLPTRMVLQHVIVNGKPASVGGIHGDTVVIPTANNKRFEIVGQAWLNADSIRGSRMRPSSMRTKILIAFITTIAGCAMAADSTLAATPPMGWNSWNRFACKVTADDVRAAADAIASNGMKAAGYVYVNIDDCWQGDRDEQGRIRPNAEVPRHEEVWWITFTAKV